MPKKLKNRCNFTIRWLLDLGNTSLEQNLKLKTLGYLLFIHAIFHLPFDCPMDNFCLLSRKKSHSPDVNHCILAINFGPKLTGRGWVSTPNLVPLGLLSQCHKPLSHSPQIAENTLPRFALSFSKMFKRSQYLKAIIA